MTNYMREQKNKINIAFVGPLPPPSGGVGIINESFQRITSGNWNVLQYNTSKGEINEDLYKGKGIKNLFHFIKNTAGFFKFLATNKFKIANLFATSNVAFIRDSIFILMLWTCRKKIIVHFHSKKEGEFFLRPRNIKYVSLTFRLVQKIIVLSRDHFHYFSKYFDISKMIIIENFVDYDLFNCEIENKKTDFLFVGRLTQKKGFFDLIEAIKTLTQRGIHPKVNALGMPKNGGARAVIGTKLKDCHLEQNIILHGNVQGIKKYNFFKSSGILVFPSHFENSPVVLKEAIAAKMAIIASDIEANKILLADIGNAKFFKAGDPIDFSNKIEELMVNPSLVKDYMLHSEACKKYDKRFAAEKIDRVIRELLN